MLRPVRVTLRGLRPSAGCPFGRLAAATLGNWASRDSRLPKLANASCLYEGAHGRNHLRLGVIFISSTCLTFEHRLAISWVDFTTLSVNGSRYA